MAQLRPCSMSSSSCILRLLPPHLEEGLSRHLPSPLLLPLEEVAPGLYLNTKR